jgi:molecular chaperone DnaJ
MKNYYEILGVDETATQDDIKKAYRQLSKQFHPDVNPDGEDRFKEISEAYENIGDEGKRNNYDNMRKNPFHGMGGNNFDINSIFEQMMGGRAKPKAPDKVVNFDITPIDSYFGVKKEVRLQNSLSCDPCNGSGGDKKVCDTCMGNGFVIQTFGTNMFRQQVQVTCPSCQGQGSTLTNPCKSCKGVGAQVKTETFMVNIPQNTDNGDFMRLRGKGDYYPNIKQRGDLIIRVNLVNDKNYEKIGSDLILKMKLNPLQLILDDKLMIEHPDGLLSVKIPEKLDTDVPLRIPSKGYKTENGTGNFYIKLSVSKNENIDEDLKNKIKSILEHVN